MQIIDKLSSVVSFRFLKFCTVGASGVVVNLVLLALFSDGLGIQVNVASALAIEASINSNFLINELWSFSDRHASQAGVLRRLFKFHLVSLVGAAVQWSVFILANHVWLVVLGGDGSGQETAVRGSLLERYVFDPIANPPDVGNLKYVSQLLGIGVATFWNYSVNFYWTWAKGAREASHG